MTDTENTPGPDGRRHFDGMWIDREIAALDPLAAVPTAPLARKVRDRGKCMTEIPLGPPPDPPAREPRPDRWLAEQICAGCPVQRECLETELRENGAHTTGVWGALSEHDRHELLARWEAHPARGAYTAHTDDEAQPDPFREWAQRVTATMPPMTDGEIANTADILRRIDARRRDANGPQGTDGRAAQ